MEHRHHSIKVLAPGVLLLVAALSACSTDRILGAEAGFGNSPKATETRLEEANLRNQKVLESVLAEVQPHVRYASDGSWVIDPRANLSSDAFEFVQKQRAAAPKNEIGRDVRAVLSVAPADVIASVNQSGVSWNWWGAKVAIPHNGVSGLSDSFSRSGGPGAVKVLLAYLGYSGWAVSAAPWLVAAYTVTIAYVDRKGGNHGVFLWVPWSLAGTVVTAQ